ncbi:uncharacterized protein KY384_009232 [Bacidia gigantensis]|uniref:uncharacterized protein n=1 Tax=Bacidia gigantensis TaxID=2732470 RepID=UPI001D05A95F|nr:uncharacterized protein KY384_009232 [Bacidia gigantensis]KAG8525588.1 hypothetical protein KY384_009232 [Bacidia gigantensis]
MSLMSITPQEKAYQLAHPNESSVPGLITWNIVGLCVVEVAVILRFWARKIQKTPYKADDYVLMVAAVLVIGHCVCVVLNIKNGFGHHTLTVTPAQSRVRGRVGYAYGFIYNTTFPISRIALVLLYKRIFNVKLWFQYACWFMIAAYCGYMISWIVVVAIQVLPVNAVWDKKVKITHTIDPRKLQLGNCSFNIATDALLLVMPLMVVWSLQMSKMHKLGVSAIFCLGVLTLIASIMRCYYTFTGKVYLGILCPCLVTFRPLVWGSYNFFSSYLNRSGRARMAKITGVDTASDSGQGSGLKKVTDHSTASTGSPFPLSRNRNTEPTLLSSKYGNGNGFGEGEGDVEAQLSTHEDDEREYNGAAGRDKGYWYHEYGAGGGTERGKGGMAVNQDVALANLDPRSEARDLGQGRTERLGTSTHAGVGGEGERRRNVPDSSIGVERGWRLESSEGRAR